MNITFKNYLSISFGDSVITFFTHLPILVIIFIQNTYQCDQKNCMITYLFFYNISSRSKVCYSKL